jgi:hypothetical protein
MSRRVAPPVAENIPFYLLGGSLGRFAAVTAVNVPGED